VEVLARIQAGSFGLEKEDTERCVRLVKTALGLPVVARACSSGQMHREFPFVFSGEAGLVEGVVDLLFQNENGLWTLVDYKTDRISSEDSREEKILRYGQQGAIYTLALAEAARIQVQDFVVCFLEDGVERSILVDDAFLQKGRALLQPESLATGPLL